MEKEPWLEASQIIIVSKMFHPYVTFLKLWLRSSINMKFYECRWETENTIH